MKDFKIKNLPAIITLSGFIIASIPFIYDSLVWKQINLGFIDSIMILNGISFMLIGFLIYIGVKYMNSIKPKVLYLATFLLVIASFSISGYFYRKLSSLPVKWKIISYEIKSDSIFETKNSVINQNIFNAQLLSNDDFSFVADPNVIQNGNQFYMFYEAFSKSKNRGLIALNTSTNGLDWTYTGIILEEPFHLSFPFVFKWENNFYMIPESSRDSSISLYKAENFPLIWKYQKTIISGQNFLDNVIFQKDSVWYLFTSTSNENLWLFYADSPLGPWKSHRQNPIKQDNPDFSRMAGRIICCNDSLIRIAQDDYPNYGNNLHSFLIQNIDSLSYSETEIDFIPTFKGRNIQSLNGVHTFNKIEKDSSIIYIIDAR